MSRKILVIRYNPLKYFINCVPAFAAIKKKHASDDITILTESSLEDICKESGFFNNVWIDKKPEWFQIGGLIEVIKRVKNARFDMVYDLQNDKRSEWYFRLVGYNKPRWNSSVIDWCSDHYEPGNEEMHFHDLIQEQLKITGIKSTTPVDLSYLANDDGSDLPDKFVMICGGGDRAKQAHKWNPSKYGDIIDHLHNKYKLTSVLVGDGGNDNLINTLIAKQAISAKPVNYSGKTSIRGIIALSKKAIFCLGNDTAPTHVAGYSGCRTIMLCSRFSPAELIAPRVKNVAAIEEPVMENIEIERVMNAIEAFALAEENNPQASFKIMAQDVKLPSDRPKKEYIVKLKQ